MSDDTRGPVWSTHCRLFHDWGKWSPPYVTGYITLVGGIPIEQTKMERHAQERFCRRCNKRQARWAGTE